MEANIKLTVDISQYSPNAEINEVIKGLQVSIKWQGKCFASIFFLIQAQFQV